MLVCHTILTLYIEPIIDVNSFSVYISMLKFSYLIFGVLYKSILFSSILWIVISDLVTILQYNDIRQSQIIK